MVTISTRIRRFGQLLRHRRRARQRLLLGRHASALRRTRSWTCRSRRSCASARHPKVVAIGEAGLDYFYDNSPRAAQAEGFRSHIAAARDTGLPLVIHARDADDDTAAILEEETRGGRVPGGAALLHRRRRLAQRAARRLGCYVSFSGILTFKKSDALRDIARERAARSAAGRDRRALPGARQVIAASATSRLMWSHTAAELARGRRASRSTSWRRRHDRQLLSPVTPRRPPRSPSPPSHELPRCTILGCGSSGGVPRIGTGVGRLRSGQPEEPAAALRAAGRALRQAAARRRCWSIRPPDLREQLLDARVEAARRRALHARPRRPHARHRRSARRRLP